MPFRCRRSVRNPHGCCADQLKDETGGSRVQDPSSPLSLPEQYRAFLHARGASDAERAGRTLPAFSHYRAGLYVIHIGLNQATRPSACSMRT